MKNFLDNLDQNVKTRTDEHGQVTQYRYDASNRLLQTIYPDGTSEETFYNVAGQAAWRTDRHAANQAVVLGSKTTHDGANRATVIERRSGVVITISTSGEVSSATVTNQGTALWTESSVYDAAGRVEVSVDKHGQITNYEFDNMGRAWKTLAPPVTVWNPVGGVNGTGEMATMRPTTETTYDDLGRVKTVKDPTGRITTSLYDELGRVVRTDYPSTLAHGVTNTQVSYDSLGRKVTETDQLGKVTSYEYDVLGNLTAVTQPAVDDAETVETTLVNPRYEYTYNHLGEQLTQTDAEGRTTSYDYDDFGRRTTRTLPGSAVETMAYDKFGRATTRIDFKGQVEEFVYDDDVRVPIAQRLNLGRVIQKRYYASAGASEDTSQRVSYTYDSLGRTATLTDPRGTTTYTYDGEGRETQVASPEGTINYVYGTTAGNGKDRLVRTYTAHDDQSYAYDALGRLATVTANVIRGVTLNEAGSYVYDLNGNLRSWSLTGRATSLHVYSYDELNRLTTLTRQNFTEPMTWNYVTDKTGRKTTDNAKFRWEYDALGRLTREQYDANTNWTLDSANDYITTFAYDLVGNRKKKVTDKVGTASDETVTYVYNSRDELTSETSTLSGTTTYIYDANGSLTSKTKGTAVETYGYDKRNKMTSYTSSSGTVTTYKYDDEGLRVQRKVGTNPTTLYLLNHHNLTGYPVVMEERSSTPTSMPTVAYVVGHDVVRQSQDAAGTGTTDGYLHLIYDGQGNMRGNVGTMNVGPTTIFATVGGTRDYSAFGELIGTGSMVSNLRHHGEYFDGITGFYFQGVRQRVTHWWMQKDPYQGNIWLPLTLHGHNFVHGDPINNSDPTGMFTMAEMLPEFEIELELESAPLVTVYPAWVKATAVITSLGIIAGGGLAWTQNGSPTTILGQYMLSVQTQLKTNPVAAGQAYQQAVQTAVAQGKGTKKKIEGLPIFWVFKSVTPQIYQNDVNAMSGTGTMGGASASSVLNYVPGISGTNRYTAITWANSVGIFGTTGVTWLDEYPFASTAEGGAKPGLRVTPVPISEQKRQAGDLNSFYTQNTSPRFGSTFMFLVVPVP